MTTAHPKAPKSRSRHTQQSGGARRAGDEAATEDLRRLPLRGWCQGLCRDPLAPLDREEARLGPAPGPDQRSQAPDRAPPAGLTAAADLGSNAQEVSPVLMTPPPSARATATSGAPAPR